MLLKNRWIILAIIMFFGVLSPKEIFAGTCSCDGLGQVISQNYNCEDNEYASCSAPTAYTSVCTCVIKGSEPDYTAPTHSPTQSPTEAPSQDITDTNNPSNGCDDKHINTALGCVPTDEGSFVNWLMSGIFGIIGGIAFLLMVYGFILVATSGGDEKKMAGAKETITSAIVGLVVCIFSIFILRLITLDILHIPEI